MTPVSRHCINNTLVICRALHHISTQRTKASKTGTDYLKKLDQPHAAWDQ